MKDFFRIYATIELHQANDVLRDMIADLSQRFPNSVHLRSQQALLEYHMRGKSAYQ